MKYSGTAWLLVVLVESTAGGTSINLAARVGDFSPGENRPAEQEPDIMEVVQLRLYSA